MWWTEVTPDEINSTKRNHESFSQVTGRENLRGYEMKKNREETNKFFAS